MRRLLFFFWFLLSGAVCFGAAMPLGTPGMVWLDNSGQPLASGQVYTYSGGTTNLKTTWSDSGKTSPNANPVILDGYGRASIFCDGVYKIVVKDSLGVAIATIDNLVYADPTSLTTGTFGSLTVTSATVGSATIAYLTAPSCTLASPTTSNGNLNTPAIANPTITGGSWNNAAISSATIGGLATCTLAGDAVNKGYTDAALAAVNATLGTFSAQIASLSTAVSGGTTTTAAVASLTAVRDSQVGKDTSSSDETLSSVNVASGSSWSVLAGPVWGVSNATSEDQYYLVTFNGSVHYYRSVASGSSYMCDGRLALADGSNLYSIAKVGYEMAAAPVTLNDFQSVPLTLSAIVKVTAGGVKSLTLSGKSSNTGTNAYTSVYYHSTKGISAVRIR